MQKLEEKNIQNDSKQIVIGRKPKQLGLLQQTVKNSGRPSFNISSYTLKYGHYLRIDISLFPNNIFCSFKDIGRNQLLYRVSAGQYKLNVSKKNLRYASNLILSNFFRDLKEKEIAISQILVIVLVAPLSLRRNIITTIFNLLKNVEDKRIAFFVKPKKFFNGCRAKKQIRKKQKRYAIYK